MGGRHNGQRTKNNGRIVHLGAESASWQGAGKASRAPKRGVALSCVAVESCDEVARKQFCGGPAKVAVAGDFAGRSAEKGCHIGRDTKWAHIATQWSGTPGSKFIWREKVGEPEIAFAFKVWVVVVGARQWFSPIIFSIVADAPDF